MLCSEQINLKEFIVLFENHKKENPPRDRRVCTVTTTRIIIAIALTVSTYTFAYVVLCEYYIIP